MRFCILADDLTGANATARAAEACGLQTTPISSPTRHALLHHLRCGKTRCPRAGPRHARAHRPRPRGPAAIATGWLGETPDLLGCASTARCADLSRTSIEALLADRRRLAPASRPPSLHRAARTGAMRPLRVPVPGWPKRRWRMIRIVRSPISCRRVDRWPHAARLGNAAPTPSGTATGVATLTAAPHGSRRPRRVLRRRDRPRHRGDRLRRPWRSGTATGVATPPARSWPVPPPPWCD